MLRKNRFYKFSFHLISIATNRRNERVGVLNIKNCTPFTTNIVMKELSTGEGLSLLMSSQNQAAIQAFCFYITPFFRSEQ